ncbi:MAG: MFS transporter [Candidatus Dormiibacterota bacterium]
MTRARLAAGQTFRALTARNYRLFFFGQIVSVSGTWMQIVAQAWLVLKLSNSGAALGLVIAAQTLPVLIGGAWGGVIADRVDRRRLLVLTQSVAAVLALTLGVLTLTGTVQLWMVVLLAAGLGCVNMVDIPTRQAFVMEMVDQEHLTNAISLNSVVMNAGRVVGPAIAGLLIVTVGIGFAFLANALSYAAVIVGLLAIRGADLHRTPRSPRTPGQLMEGLRYVWGNPELRTPLLMMALVGTFAYEFTVSLPLLARYTFDVGAGGLGLMNSVMAGGAVVGGLVTAARARPSAKRLAIAALLFGGSLVLAAAAPNFAIVLVLMAGAGAASIFFAAMANTSIQLAASAEMRGRVMALYAIAFMGSTPIGGPIVGLVGQAVDPRAALALGGLATIVAGLFGWYTLARAASPAAPRSPAETVPLGKPAA